MNQTKSERFFMFIQGSGELSLMAESYASTEIGWKIKDIILLTSF